MPLLHWFFRVKNLASYALPCKATLLFHHKNITVNVTPKSTPKSFSPKQEQVCNTCRSAGKNEPRLVGTFINAVTAQISFLTQIGTFLCLRESFAPLLFPCFPLSLSGPTIVIKSIACSPRLPLSFSPFLVSSFPFVPASPRPPWIPCFFPTG